MPVHQRQKLPQRYIKLKYAQYRNGIILENTSLKFLLAYIILAYFTVADFLEYHSDVLLIIRSIPVLALTIFIGMQLTLFKKDNKLAMTCYNGFLLSLLIMAYANILFMREPEFAKTIAGRTILVLAIVGLEARGNWKTISLLQGIPLVLFFVFAWIIEIPHSYVNSVLYSQIVALVVLNIVIAEYRNRILYESFLREQNFIFEQTKNEALISELQATNKKIQEQKREIQAQKEEIDTQYEEISSQRDFAERQRDMIISQKDELTDSIIYAKRIQVAMLSNLEVLQKNTAESMLLYMPKDIVSGDFYWSAKVDNFLIFSVGDCTGHGVPGGFMSMLGISFLNEIVDRHKQKVPNLILHSLRETVINSLHQTNKDNNSANDGMDIAVACIDIDNQKLYFSGANNSLLLYRNDDDDPLELKGDKMPIAIYPLMRDFTLQSVDLRKGDTIYLFSDGFGDQFGGPRGKKFMHKNFKKTLGSIHNIPMEEQKLFLSSTIKNWMLGHEKHYSAVNAQVDDITVLGVRI